MAWVFDEDQLGEESRHRIALALLRLSESGKIVFIGREETTMLSAHEIAALMVLGSRGPFADLDPQDIAALAKRRLIEICQCHEFYRCPVRVTHEGRHILAAMGTPIAKLSYRPPCTKARRGANKLPVLIK